MKLTHVPLEQLKVSATNMRHGRKRPEIADILPSIRARGVQQPLLVRANGKGYEIVAGRRRYFALAALAKEIGEAPPVPCAVMDETGDADAVEASLIENTARLDPDEVARWETFARLHREGRTPAEIAATFGVTELAVRRTLELGTLLPDIREAYRTGEIDADTVRQLTVATKARQADWLALFNDPRERAPGGWQLKQWLFGAEIATDAALFPLDRYTGRFVTDLFAETGYFEDIDAFWSLQNAAVAARRDALLNTGWAEVAVLDVGERFVGWQHVAAAKADGGRVYIEVRADGTVTEHAGFITEKEHRSRERRKAKDGDEDGNAGAASRPGTYSRRR